MVAAEEGTLREGGLGSVLGTFPELVDKALVRRLLRSLVKRTLSVIERRFLVDAAFARLRSIFKSEAE